MKTILSILFLMTVTLLQAQVTPSTKLTNTTGNPAATLNSSTLNTGSASGVNPNGNPGTILQKTSISNELLQPGTVPPAATTTIPNPPPNPQSNINTNQTPVNTNNNVQGTAPVIQGTTVSPVNNGNSLPNTTDPATLNAPGAMVTPLATPAGNTATVNTVSGEGSTPVMPVVPATTVGAENNNKNMRLGSGIINSDMNSGNVSNSDVHTTGSTTMNNLERQNTGINRFAALPVLCTYVPDEIVLMLKNKYADRLYDITMMKKGSGLTDDKYLVRLQDNGMIISESVNGQGIVMK